MLKILTDKKSLIFLQFLTQAIFILFPKVTPWFTLTNPLNELIVCFYQISSQTIRWGAFCWATLSAYFLLGYRKNLFRRVFEVVITPQRRPKTTSTALTFNLFTSSVMESARSSTSFSRQYSWQKCSPSLSLWLQWQFA